MIFNRVWGMPNKNTCSIKPIGEFVKRYLKGVSVDPFARDLDWATHTNDLNTTTKAQYNLDALDFLVLMKDVEAESVIFDPPFSPRQIKECYDSIGKKMGQMDAFRTHWKPERDATNDLLVPGGVVLSFGWNSIGMGQKRGYEIEEILLVCHGPGHNDTICMAERKPLNPSSGE